MMTRLHKSFFQNKGVPDIYTLPPPIAITHRHHPSLLPTDIGDDCWLTVMADGDG